MGGRLAHTIFLPKDIFHPFLFSSRGLHDRSLSSSLFSSVFVLVSSICVLSISIMSLSPPPSFSSSVSSCRRLMLVCQHYSYFSGAGSHCTLCVCVSERVSERVRLLHQAVELLCTCCIRYFRQRNCTPLTSVTHCRALLFLLH